ncbi:head-tail connector protein [Lactiplantibacillus plantarum]|uniref:head-tail connector protein n=1 Tax=Lactiplantibacillus plantarum TaxID=1590 RepID=UPI0030B09604
MANIDGLKLALRLDDTGDDEIDTPIKIALTRCLNAAKSYVHSAIAANQLEEMLADDSEGQSLYDVAVYSLAVAYYQNPSALSNSHGYSVDLVLNSIIGQLRGRYLTWRSGTDGEKV